jgi:transcription-repair coupling factor (superfamily II helicase)
VADAGEYAVRGSIFDIFPSGLESGLRLDFFGDEIETLRLFDPGTQRTTGTCPSTCCCPPARPCWMRRHQALPQPLPRDVWRQCHQRSALSGDYRWAATGGDGTLAAAAGRTDGTLFDHLARPIC